MASRSGARSHGDNSLISYLKGMINHRIILEFSDLTDYEGELESLCIEQDVNGKNFFALFFTDGNSFSLNDVATFRPKEVPKHNPFKGPQRKPKPKIPQTRKIQSLTLAQIATTLNESKT